MSRYLEEKPVIDHRTIDERALMALAERAAARPQLNSGGSTYESPQGRVYCPEPDTTATNQTTTYYASTLTIGPGTVLNIGPDPTGQVPGTGTIVINGPVYVTEETTQTLSSTTNNLDVTSNWPGGVIDIPTAGGTPVLLTGLMPPSLTQATSITLRVPATSTSSLVLTSQDGRSTATNQFSLPGNVPVSIPPGGKLTISYNPTSQRWELPQGTALPTVPSYGTLYAPPLLTTSTSNFDPTAGGTLAYPQTIQLSTSSSVSLTGLAPPVLTGGQTVAVTLTNAGANPLTLTNQDGSSTAANRFNLGANVTLSPGQTLPIYYDPGTQRWLPAGTVPSTGSAVNALTSYSGTTTNAFVALFNLTNANGLHGICAIHNSGSSNSLSYRIAFTDAFGNTGQASGTVGGTGYARLDFHVDALNTYSIGVYPPFTEVKVEVEDTVGGSHTTYQAYLSLVG